MYPLNGWHMRLPEDAKQRFAVSYKTIMHYRKLDESEIKETSTITSKNFRERRTIEEALLSIIVGATYLEASLIIHWIMVPNSHVPHTDPLIVAILLFLAIATCGCGVLVLAAMLSWYLVRIIAGKESR